MISFLHPTLSLCKPTLSRVRTLPNIHIRSSLSGLALALRSTATSHGSTTSLANPTATNLSSPNSVSTVAPPPLSHMAKNQRIRRFNVERVPNDAIPTAATDDASSGIGLAARRSSNVFTNLALGNRMDTLMAGPAHGGASLPTTPGGSFRFTIEPSPYGAATPPPPPRSPLPPSGRMPPSQGIPIPMATRRESVPIGFGAASSMAALGSPPMGRYSVSAGGGGQTPPASSPLYGNAGGLQGQQYLDVYGSSGGSGPGSFSRATTPQRTMMSAIVAANRRFGGPFVVCLLCARSRFTC